MALRDVVNAGAIAQNDHLIDKNSKLNAQTQHLRNQALANQIQAKDQINDLEEENERLEKENAFYKALLARPMAEIAAVNSDFKETYEKQQEILGTWIVTQKAFRELAMQMGIEVGKSKDEISAAAKVETENVLNNKTKHGNDFAKDENDEWAIYYAPKIRQRFKK